MAKKVTAWKPKGMNRDLSVSAFSSEFTFENINLRLSTNETNTQLSWVTEKGPKLMTIAQPSQQNTLTSPDKDFSWDQTDIKGTVIGTAIINHTLVLFSTESRPNHHVDYIYALKYLDNSKNISARLIYDGNLGFDVEHPIETLVSYESELIQKVYWTDGINQPRMINIAKVNPTYKETSFDFINEIDLNETIEVQKLLGASGIFSPGVIQYAFTYYNKYGQESNIFNVTPLYYISHKDRGASPDETAVENAFRITIKNPDTSFDYLRIYSIQRTSLNDVPFVKRIQDISLKDVAKGGSVSYLDVGTTGDTVDPMSLLYKGGETIIAETLEQKDNTLFLGNLSIPKKRIENVSKEKIEEAITKKDITLNESTREIDATEISSGSYAYSNQLTAYVDSNIDTQLKKSVPCAGFMKGEIYRLGMQFQHKTGKWSDPIWIDDKEMISQNFTIDGNKIKFPIFSCTLKKSYVEGFINNDYRRVRAVAVMPTIQDRNIICQGVTCPTVYTANHRDDDKDKDIYAQSSWFFRTGISTSTQVKDNGAVYPKGLDILYYNDRGIDNNSPSQGDTAYNPENIKSVEIEGAYKIENKYRIDGNFITFHSPDIEFDPQLSATDYQSFVYNKVGEAKFSNTMSDIEIQTETPTVSSAGGGFIHKSFTDELSYGIVAGLFYDDFIVDEMKGEDDQTRKFKAFDREGSPVKWMVYPWQADGSLNNDIERPTSAGVSTAVLKKKVISNLRYSSTSTWSNSQANPKFINAQLYNSNEPVIVKLGDKIYQGNIDTILNPDYADGKYFAFNGYNSSIDDANIETPFTTKVRYKTFSLQPSVSDKQGVYYYNGNNTNWTRVAIGGNSGYLGDEYPGLVMKKSFVRMKYKSTPHLVIEPSVTPTSNNDSLPIINIKRSEVPMRFGGTSQDALKENTWIPCGEPVVLSSTGNTTFYYSYGDTYFQRWDCLKTYPFTRDDKNQIVEIGSFMLATRVNIDGRYDRNRGQLSNINMSPVNFNLLNPIYSQQDNFFSYKIQDEDTYKDNYFPNQLTWTLNKTSGADVDNWTTVTLANMLELDGDKGEIRSLQRLNDQIIAFQDSGISQILYNENVQISSTQGVPIEIANSGKVQGNRYFTDTVGCSNKWSIVQTPSGLYFMDSNSKDIYLFNSQLTNISLNKGFNTWCKNNIPSSKLKWTPRFLNKCFIGCYDKKNQDVLFINNETSLAFSEKFGTFTSFYDYEKTPYLCSLDDNNIWIREDLGKTSLYEHQAGEYCNFFGYNKPYSMTLIANPEPQLDKTFTNLEFRANVQGDGTYVSNTDAFTSSLPFDYLETWNEYQHGITELANKTGYDAIRHHMRYDNTSSLNRDFRIWRCDIPRDNADVTENEMLLGIKRFKARPMDRMRNPWIYMKLQKNQANALKTLPKSEIHDIVLTYYN